MKDLAKAKLKMLQNAIQSNWIEGVKFVLKSGFDFSTYSDADQEVIFNMAISEGEVDDDTDSLQLLIDYGIDVNLSDDYALQVAARCGALECAKLLIKNGANVQAKNNAAFLHAASKSNLEMVKLLVENGADVNVSEGHALQSAINTGNKEMVKYLIEQNIDINEGLIAACVLYKNELDIVKLLVDNGADVNTCDGEALFCALRRGHLDIAKYLVEQGADINARDDILSWARYIVRLPNNANVGHIYTMGNEITMGNESVLYHKTDGSSIVEAARYVLSLIEEDTEDIDVSDDDISHLQAMAEKRGYKLVKD